MPLRSLRLLTALLTVVLVPGLARAGGGDQTTVQVVDGYTVTLTLPPDRIQTGPNDVSVTIDAPDGSAVTEASVSAAVIAYAAGGHGNSHGEAAVTSQAAAHGDDHGSTSAGSHGDDHAADGHGHEAIPTMLWSGTEAGAYQGILHFDQAGTATVVVAFTVAGRERAALFAVPVVQARPRTLVIGGFFLLNGLAIVTAAVLKRRMPQKGRTGAAARGAPAPAATTVQFGTVPVTSEEERPV